MGPHSFKCGKTATLRIKVRVDDTSMGPHSFKCGKMQEEIKTARYEDNFNGAALFQVRKVRRASNRRYHGILTSMGPHSFKCGKPPKPNAPKVANPSTSMGPHSFKCGKVKIHAGADIVSPHFNGAALFQVRKDK